MFFVGHHEVTEEEKDVGFDAGKAVLERFEEWTLVKVIVVRMGVNERLGNVDETGCGWRCSYLRLGSSADVQTQRHADGQKQSRQEQRHAALPINATVEAGPCAWTAT
jgi:hypothetical protein